MYIRKEDLSEEARKAIEGDELEGENYVMLYTLWEVNDLFHDVLDEIPVAIYQPFHERGLIEDPHVYEAQSDAVERVMKVIWDRVERMRSEARKGGE
jgi:hypothetical protein